MQQPDTTTKQSKLTLTVFLAVVSIATTSAQRNDLHKTIHELAAQVDGQVGVAIMNLSTNDTLIYNANGVFAMQSVYKFPLALAVLKKVDQKKLSLNQKIKITKQDLHPNTLSPLRDKYPDQNIEITLLELLHYTVVESDNNACDVLFGLLKGPRNVQKYVESVDVKEMKIEATEEEMSKDWYVQFTNWSKPRAMLRLLELFYKKKLLSTSSYEILWKMMAETSRGNNRIKGLLPEGTEVIHRPGTGPTNNEGKIGAVNDVGIVKLPNGKYFAIVVYAGRSTNDLAMLEKIIAEITLAAYKSDWLN